jgi:hypothetical protein
LYAYISIFKGPVLFSIKLLFQGNLCSDFSDDNIYGCSHANPANSRYCEMCGKVTYYFKKGMLRSWWDVVDYEAEDEYIYVAILIISVICSTTFLHAS